MQLESIVRTKQIRIKAEINEVEDGKSIEKISKDKSQFLKKKTNDKVLAG